MRPTNHHHANSLLQSFASLLVKPCHQRSFTAVLTLFLNTQLKTLLQNIQLVSASTASRFLNRVGLSEEELWRLLNRWQRQRLFEAYANRPGRKPDVVLKVDWTCIEKTGGKLPFVRVFGGRFGIQLVTLHACMGDYQLPLGQRIYRGKGTPTPVKLALELLAQHPPACWPSRVVLLADSGFQAKDFLKGASKLGFARVIVGMQHDRTCTGGEQLHDINQRGCRIELHDLPGVEFYLSWLDIKRNGKKKRFYIVATWQASGRWLTRRYRQRWLIESFFNAVKYDFGLKETRLRTETGVGRWIFFSFLAYSLASIERTLGARRRYTPERWSLTLGQAAKRILSRYFAHLQLTLLQTRCRLLENDLARQELRLDYQRR